MNKKLVYCILLYFYYYYTIILPTTTTTTRYGGGVKMRKIERYQKDAQDAHFTGICGHIIFISQVEIRENKPRTLLTGE
tara:strand:- start:370 stop:606 length:237 start_codon:yes stop_codon:yes gene_type:complete